MIKNLYLHQKCLNFLEKTSVQFFGVWEGMKRSLISEEVKKGLKKVWGWRRGFEDKKNSGMIIFTSLSLDIKQFFEIKKNKIN